MKKVLFVSGSLNRGGAQRVITILADDYVKHGWEAHMAVLLDDKVGYEISKKIVIHSIVRRGGQAINAIRWIRDIKDILADLKPDVIISFAGRINIISMLAAIGTGIPVIVSERNDPAHDRRSKPERLLCRVFYSRADRVVFQTQYQASCYRKWCKTNSVIIGNPISAPAYEGEHPGKDILCVGKLMDQKNHPMMIRAFAKLADEYPEKQVFIYGEGAKREELQALIDGEGMTARIHLCGNSDHIFDVMREYQYFVMCSDYEGLSNALLEAMVSGMVCVTTAWNGVEEIIEDGVNGYLIPVGDEAALTDKLRTVFSTDNSGICSRGIETAKKFSSDQIMQDWRDAVHGLTDAGKG